MDLLQGHKGIQYTGAIKGTYSLVPCKEPVRHVQASGFEAWRLGSRRTVGLRLGV